MLRVEMHDAANALVMKLEGRFVGEYAEYTRALVTRCKTDLKLLVDLTEVTSLDSAGEEVLSFFGRLGAEFIADNVYARYLCERLYLPLAPEALLHRSSPHTKSKAARNRAGNPQPCEEQHASRGQ
jgi:hypothetical protein